MLTLRDFISDYQRMVINGDSKKPDVVESLITTYYAHIADQCRSYLSSK
ncbi:hypothetical protein [Escherichia phage EP_H11]|nr:hypothetical protein [Escherichia phage EP_H11]